MIKINSNQKAPRNAIINLDCFQIVGFKPAWRLDFKGFTNAGNLWKLFLKELLNIWLLVFSFARV
jgi:hypothetical protein